MELWLCQRVASPGSIVVLKVWPFLNSMLFHQAWWSESYRASLTQVNDTHLCFSTNVPSLARCQIRRLGSRKWKTIFTRIGTLLSVRNAHLVGRWHQRMAHSHRVQNWVWSGSKLDREEHAKLPGSAGACTGKQGWTAFQGRRGEAPVSRGV